MATRLNQPPEYKLSVMYAQDNITDEMRAFEGFLKNAVSVQLRLSR